MLTWNVSAKIKAGAAEQAGLAEAAMTGLRAYRTLAIRVSPGYDADLPFGGVELVAQVSAALPLYAVDIFNEAVFTVLDVTPVCLEVWDSQPDVVDEDRARGMGALAR